jgi:hypothetical protein
MSFAKWCKCLASVKLKFCGLSLFNKIGVICSIVFINNDTFTICISTIYLHCTSFSDFLFFGLS